MKAEDHLLKSGGFTENIREQMENLLCGLLGESALPKIKERYDAIATGNCFLEDFIPLDEKSPFAGLRKSKDVIGLDFPVWFGNNSGKKPIMIVCQDSGRDADYHVGRKEVIVTALFGVHNKKWREGPHGEPFAQMVKRLLEDGYPVYVTDSIKFFATSFDEEKEEYGPNSQLNKKFRNSYLDILRKEIDIIDPEAVISMGDYAKKMIACLDLNDRVKAHIKHLSYRYDKEHHKFRGIYLAEQILDKIKDEKTKQHS